MSGSVKECKYHLCLNESTISYRGRSTIVFRFVNGLRVLASSLCNQGSLPKLLQTVVLWPDACIEHIIQLFRKNEGALICCKRSTSLTKINLSYGPFVSKWNTGLKLKSLERQCGYTILYIHMWVHVTFCERITHTHSGA